MSLSMTTTPTHHTHRKASQALEDGRFLFVTDLGRRPTVYASNTTRHTQNVYRNGGFVADLDPSPRNWPQNSYHPRAVVIGPDRLVYVSNMPEYPLPGSPPPVGGIGGQVLRFYQNGGFKDVFINDAGGVGRLNRPQGLVFGPDGNLYVTSFRDNLQPTTPGNTDAIRIYNGKTGKFLGSIDLDNPPGNAGARAYAQALLFGPRGKLFVPITIVAVPGGPPTAGEIRRYDVRTKTYDVFVPAGTLASPWFLTFGKTDPATLAYRHRD